MKDNYIIPNWPAPSSVQAYFTTRKGGFSKAPFDEFNLANHVKDQEKAVMANRTQLIKDLSLPAQPVWLNQVHSTDVIILEETPKNIPTADSSMTSKKHVICTVMSADCLPILLCDQKGTQVAAIHAGWKGLAKGIIFETLKKMKYSSSNPILACLGPAIGPSAFEIDESVKANLSQFLTKKDSQLAFKALKSKPNHYLANLYKIATCHLNACDVFSISGGEYCTYKQSDLFFSYRKSKGNTGRMAGLIWLT
jgi:polyphenol oxidase